MPPKQEKQGVQEALLAQLRDTINDGSRKSFFTCGGEIPIYASSEKQPPEESGEDIPRAPPVTLRWDSPETSVPDPQTKLCLPLEPTTRENFQRLLSDMSPASFGRGGEDVHDETYRKASKMNPESFSTNFNPYELGVMDTVTQVLLPSAAKSDDVRGVRAELYKLNVYQGPSGKFKAHVDTPRSSEQFGSLVICLPVAHTGGQLVVRHGGQDMTFDWGTPTSETGTSFIRWAAFYSDCEHEVLEVTNGHRVTLTYNLYATSGSGRLTACGHIMDPMHLPLSDTVNGLLNNPKFMPKGGKLGFYCSHAYAHSNPKQAPMPSVLKGIDMVIWECFDRQFGLQTAAYPVIPPHFESKWDDEPTVGMIGNDFQVRKTDLIIGDCFTMRNLYEEWHRVDFKFDDVTWLSEPRHEELQLMYMAYGNEASAATKYSNCAIVVAIPAFEDRVQIMDD